MADVSVVQGGDGERRCGGKEAGEAAHEAGL